jgi:FKBP-type peptidyl-prolyl cis-trans isomerase 2
MSKPIEIITEAEEVSSKPVNKMTTADLGTLVRERTFLPGESGEQKLIEMIDTIITRATRGDMKAAAIIFERGWGKVPETFVQTVSSEGTSKITIITPDGNQLLLD